MKLETQVFFASMDQRSERAAGESACASLVAVIADWLQRNSFEMPNKSEFDRLIRDGSSEWRNLCETQVLKEQFPDRHFDLETVMDAKIRPISVIPEKSYVGFFHPEGISEESCYDILRGSMSFDEIWDEISRQASDYPLVYIVSWNDHFFVLKIEQDAYYIIDTLGERLFEGGSQAYILKFDRDTVLKQIPTDAKGSVKATARQKKVVGNEKADKDRKNMEEEDLVVVCDGKECCKEYIKRFLAAIPMRELESDIKKGRTSTVRLHQRLQIEFHFTDVIF